MAGMILSKFEKIMHRFCKDIGIDKRSLLKLLLGDDPSKNHLQDSMAKESLTGDSSELLKHKDSGGSQVLSSFNTGAAAQLAYNNIVGSAADIDSLQQ